MNSLKLGLLIGIFTIGCGSDTTGSAIDAALGGGPDSAGGGGGIDSGTPSADDLVPPEAGKGFQLRSKEFVMPAGTEQTYCWYFTIPTTAAAGVKRWESKMTTGSHHLIVFFTQAAQQPDDTLQPNCGLLGSGGLSSIPIWTYSAQEEYHEALMPDGVGMSIGAQQHGYIQMHYLNVGDEDLTVHVTVNGHTFAPGESFTPAAAYVTYNGNISIPAGVGMTGSAEGSCDVPAGKSFFALSTHAHRRSTTTWVKDGSDMLFMSTDWEHPGIKRWDAPSFYKFNGKLNYHCDYTNDLPNAVHTGDSAQTDEMCMAVGYFFPANKPVFCYNSQVISF